MERDAWTAAVVRDPVRRAAALRRARMVESVCSLGAAAFMIVAFWALFDDGTRLGGLAPVQAVGLAIICMVGLLTIAAGGGIKRRLILLADELEARGR